MHEKRPVAHLETRHTRREAVLLGVSALLGTAGIATIHAGLESPTPPIPDDIPQSSPPVATPELHALSTVNDEKLDEYKARYRVFGDTDVETVLIADPVLQEIELPRLMIKTALERKDWAHARGEELTTYGAWISFVSAQLPERDTKADIALDLFNPYRYLPGNRHLEEAKARGTLLREPQELFAAAITTFALYPDAFIERWNELPDQEAYHEHSSDQQIISPSWEKSLTRMTADTAINLALSLVADRPGEGEGLRQQKLASVAPRIPIIKFQLEL